MPEWTREEGYLGVLQVLDPTAPKFNKGYYRMQHADEYLQQAFAEVPKTVVIGYNDKIP